MIILYPTETVYGLGVPVFEPEALEMLCHLKERDIRKVVSWLVKDVSEIGKYAEMSAAAAEIAKRFLPGPLTLVLPAKDTVPKEYISPEEGTIGIRVSSDPIAQKLIRECMTPLTATSANISDMLVLQTPQQILEQFGEKASMIDRVIDDGSRNGTPSTVIRIIGKKIDILREGAIPLSEIQEYQSA